MNHPRPIRSPSRGEPRDDGPRPVSLRVEDYLLLDQRGAFEGYNRTELVGGEIVYMNAQHLPHARVKFDLAFALRMRLEAARSPLTVCVEVSVLLSPQDMPEPDVLLASKADGDGFVSVDALSLVIEVADASLAYDLGTKKQRYAAAGVPEYWVVDVSGRVVHQFWSPADCAFTDHREVKLGEPLAAATIAGLAIETKGLG